MNVQILYRDERVIVVSKPSGLSTTTPDGGDCLVRRVGEIDPDAPQLHATSRLDAEVTGIVTFARTREANRAILEARRAGAYRRLYVALVSGEPSSATWSGSIGIDPTDPRKRRIDPQGKPSRTHVEQVERAGPLALLTLRPQTGRTHQIRVHAASEGCPIFGDRHYGGEKRIALPNGRVLTARRVMLHCAKVELLGQTHTCPPPEDFASLWTRARG